MVSVPLWVVVVEQQMTITMLMVVVCMTMSMTPRYGHSPNSQYGLVVVTTYYSFDVGSFVGRDVVDL